MKKKLKPINFPPLGLYMVKVQIPPGYLDSGKIVSLYCSFSYKTKNHVAFKVLQSKQNYLVWAKHFNIITVHKGKLSKYHLIDDYYFE